MHNAIGRQETDFMDVDQLIPLAYQPEPATHLADAYFASAAPLFQIHEAKHDESPRESEVEPALDAEIDPRFKDGTHLYVLGSQAHRQGRYDEAEVQLNQSRALFSKIGFRFGEIMVQNSIALVWFEVGMYERAVCELTRSIELSQEIGLVRIEAWATALLSTVYLNLGRIITAKETALRAVEIGNTVQDRFLEGHTAYCLGLALAGNHEWNAAKAALTRSAEVRSEIKGSHLWIEPIIGLIEISLMHATADTMKAVADQILAILDRDLRLQGVLEPLRIHEVIHRYLLAQGDARADRVLRRAHRICLSRSKKITIRSMRSAYLERVVAHNRIMLRADRMLNRTVYW